MTVVLEVIQSVVDQLPPRPVPSRSSNTLPTPHTVLAR
jgi:hypothetical protein